MPDAHSRSWRQTAAKVPALDRALRRLRRADEIEALQRELAQRPAAPRMDPAQSAAVADGVEPFLRWAPPGHYYSPVPDLNDIRRQAARIYHQPERLEGLELNADAQLAMFKQLAPLARDRTLCAEPDPSARYFVNNPSYGVGDALTLQAFMRHLRPKRYLEVGSGWTTALALDTNERYLDGRTQLTCIEPYPIDLRKLLREGDNVELIESPVQDVPMARFTELEAGDILFIDCSHVVKTGSDAHYLVTRVLPVVPVGVYVHIHDIFWPFEYPKPWVEEGRAWSEIYLLHAFLLFNSSFEIVLFNDWMEACHHDLIDSEVPAMTANTGGAIWLRRV